jgi:hypothetical protein
VCCCGLSRRNQRLSAFHQRPKAICIVDQARSPAFTQEWLNVCWLCVFPRLEATSGDGERLDAGEANPGYGLMFVVDDV